MCLGDEDMTPMYMPMRVKDKMSSFLCLHNDISKNLLLSTIVAFIVLRNNDDDDVNLGKAIPMALQQMEHGYNMHKIDLEVQAHQSPTFGSSVTQQCFIGNTITHPSGV